MKIVLIAGWLGSGKTTLILEMGRRLSERGIRMAVLVNEIGAIPVDGKVVQEYGLVVKDLGGGCICCQIAGNMAKTVAVLAKELSPDLVIIEPTGLAVPSSIKETIASFTYDVDVRVGPTIVLLDTTRLEKLLHYESLRRLVTAQLQEADIIALSKGDAAGEDTKNRARDEVREINPHARIVDLSSRTGSGLDYLIQAAQGIGATW
jgi:G3E family GTPase